MVPISTSHRTQWDHKKNTSYNDIEDKHNNTKKTYLTEDNSKQAKDNISIFTNNICNTQLN
jgi:hypothetical protein